MFYYVPSTTQAYDRMLDLRGAVALRVFLRNLPRWSAHAMVAVVFLHMCHDGQGRGLDAEYSHGQDEFWPKPLLGYVVQPNWRKEGQGVHGGQVRPVPHRRGFCVVP
jgi:hypothetical protein